MTIYPFDVERVADLWSSYLGTDVQSEEVMAMLVILAASQICPGIDKPFNEIESLARVGGKLARDRAAIPAM